MRLICLPQCVIKDTLIHTGASQLWAQREAEGDRKSENAKKSLVPTLAQAIPEHERKSRTKTAARVEMKPTTFDKARKVVDGTCSA